MATLYIYWKSGITQEMPNVCKYFAMQVVNDLKKHVKSDSFTYKIK